VEKKIHECPKFEVFTCCCHFVFTTGGAQQQAALTQQTLAVAEIIAPFALHTDQICIL